MLVSMLENSPSEHFHIHIIADDVSPDSLEMLSKTVRSYGSEITIYTEVKHLLKGCLPPEGYTHITLTAYYRCFLDTILPESIDKVLYLDSDMVLCEDIKKLWEMNISGFSLGAVEDTYRDDSRYERLSIPQESLYFNSGVLLINLDYWRKANNWPNCLKLIIEGHCIHKNHDQDVLNRLYHDSKTLLPFRWNMQDGVFRKKQKVRPEIRTELELDVQNPAVIHYTGSRKPWHYFSFHPGKQLYFKYLDKTPWKGERPKPTMEQRWKYFTYSLNAALGLKNGYRKTQ